MNPVETGRWASVPNAPIELDDFMAKFCEHLSKKTRIYRKRAPLAAAKHNTVTMPPLATARKHGHANKYFTHDLLAAWQGDTRTRALNCRRRCLPSHSIP